ncbi:methyltransferase domain-containing protein [Thiosulfativibrio zosterae]|uniref:Rhodanese domain-containing protein n=1 Tax=Thiosulfativibrio zosterae TaxID=2675053 RepID=A0A6F8PNN4_9GAMM|nr:methyltransferase domain-containing protein [Thiosulfativibrio zosterae]BBP43600.1 hypothetical protein THMIRHAT_13460 [Thiosulfativibrio zosterae]
MNLPLIDLRNTPEYCAGHLVGATHIPWAELPERLNELPARPALLSIMGSETDCIAAQAYLVSKGYRVKIEVDWQAKLTQKQPGLVSFGTESRILWSPSPLIKEWLTLVQADLHQPLKNLKAIDLGCGGGRDAVFLAQQGLFVKAIEHKPAVLERAQQLAKHHQATIDFKSCDLTDPNCYGEQDFERWDLVVCIRFLNRQLFPVMRQSIRPKGFVVFQTFTEGCEVFGSPKNPNFILKPAELSEVFHDFTILIDRIDSLPDGRPVASFIAQKKG